VSEEDPEPELANTDRVVHVAHNYRIDPGKFVIEKEATLRKDYNIGKIIRMVELKWRINHLTHIKFGVERGVKSIRLSHETEIPLEVELLKGIDHPCAYKILEIYRDHRWIHLVRSPINGQVMSEWYETFIKTLPPVEDEEQAPKKNIFQKSK
jgi:serine/threonine protein kinase